MAAAAAGGGVIVAITSVCLFCWWAWCFSGSRGGSSGEIRVKVLPGGGFVWQFTLKEIERATQGFDPANMLGKGGYGTVYKGVGPHGELWAVKRAHVKADPSLYNPEFDDEVNTIAPMNHRNLVPLRGFCSEGGEQILVYDFVENGTLKHRLHASEEPLTYSQRLEIAIGAARGIHYLHSFAKDPVIHRDIKSENILLDSNLQAKVADFGLLKPMQNAEDTHVSTRLAGTFGYMDPEYRALGQVTTKSDVYSFGVMLLEIFTGRKPVLNDDDEPDCEETMPMITLVRWVSQRSKTGNYEGMVDSRMGGDYPLLLVKRIIRLGRMCTNDLGDHRPTMEDVVRRLEDVKKGASDLDDDVYMSHRSTTHGGWGLDAVDSSSSSKSSTFHAPVSHRPMPK